MDFQLYLKKRFDRRRVYIFKKFFLNKPNTQNMPKFGWQHAASSNQTVPAKLLPYKGHKNYTINLKVEAALLDQAIRLNCQDINSLLCIQLQLAGGEGYPRGSTGGDHTPLGFFSSMLQTQLLGSIKPQNKLCIKLEVSIPDYLQYKCPYRSCLFHLIPARYDHDHRFNGFFF